MPADIASGPNCAARAAVSKFSWLASYIGVNSVNILPLTFVHFVKVDLKRVCGSFEPY